MEGNSKGDFRNYPENEPFVGPPSYRGTGGMVIIQQRGPLGRLWNRLTGWESTFEWHTHPDLGNPSAPPTWPSDYPRRGVPSVVVTRETIFLINPGASKGQYLTEPTQNILTNWRP